MTRLLQHLQVASGGRDLIVPERVVVVADDAARGHLYSNPANNLTPRWMAGTAGAHPSLALCESAFRGSAGPVLRAEPAGTAVRICGSGSYSSSGEAATSARSAKGISPLRFGALGHLFRLPERASVSLCFHAGETGMERVRAAGKAIRAQRKCFRERGTHGVRG